MAGATKQGKTTAVNSLILSLLYSRTPDEVKFVLIDPKDFDLKVYRSLDAESFRKALGGCRRTRRRG